MSDSEDMSDSEASSSSPERSVDLIREFLEEDDGPFSLDSQDQRLVFREYILRALGVGNETFESPQPLQLVGSGKFGPICSALPYARSTNPLRIKGTTHYNKIVSFWDAAWLGFALFHPMASSGQWRRLELASIYLLQEFSDPFPPEYVLELMAKGNNLRAAHSVDKESATVTAYHMATLGVGTVVRRMPQEDADLVLTVSDPMTIDICVASTDVSTYNPWEMVILPGYGMAWVQSTDILEVVALPPSICGIRELSILGCMIDSDTIKSILRLLGPSLQVLRLSGLSDGQIQDITEACPHLRVLAVETQGTLAAVQFPPQLQLLHPILNTTEQLDFASTRLGELKQLKTLRLAIDRIPTTHDVEHFILPLLRAKPRLLGFEWTSHCEPPPDVSEIISRILAGIWASLEKSHDDIAIERDAPPTATMIALLSVVDHYSRKSTSALGRIERDSIEMIGSFVGTTVKRQVVITV